MSDEKKTPETEDVPEKLVMPWEKTGEEGSSDADIAEGIQSAVEARPIQTHDVGRTEEDEAYEARHRERAKKKLANPEEFEGEDGLSVEEAASLFGDILDQHLGDDADDADDADDTDESDDEDDEDDAVTEPVEIDDQTVVTVKINGEEQHITLREALDGYQRQADYTRKTQELARDRQFVDSHRAVLAERAEAYAAKLGQMNMALSQHFTPDQIASLENEYVRVQGELVALAGHQQLEHLQKEQGLLVEAMGWSDPEVARQEAQEIAEYAIEVLGFTPEEVQQSADHRALVMARKAMLYDRMVEKNDKTKQEVRGKRQKVKRVLKPGQRSTTSKSQKGKRNVKSAMARARSTGRVEDAAAALLALEGDE